MEQREGFFPRPDLGTPNLKSPDLALSESPEMKRRGKGLPLGYGRTVVLIGVSAQERRSKKKDAKRKHSAAVVATPPPPPPPPPPPHPLPPPTLEERLMSPLPASRYGPPMYFAMPAPPAPHTAPRRKKRSKRGDDVEGVLYFNSFIQQQQQPAQQLVQPHFPHHQQRRLFS